MSKKVAIIASNGGLFDAYKVFNIATAAAASDAEVEIFFTFDGLNLIHKEGMDNLPIPEGREGLIDGFKAQNTPTIPELIDMSLEMGVKFIACQMTMDVMGLEIDALVEGTEVAGAAKFVHFGTEADLSLSF